MSPIVVVVVGTLAVITSAMADTPQVYRSLSNPITTSSIHGATVGLKSFSYCLWFVYSLQTSSYFLSVACVLTLMNQILIIHAKYILRRRLKSRSGTVIKQQEIRENVEIIQFVG